MIRFLICLAVLLVVSSDASADTLWGHARKMRRSGRIWHDSRRGGGPEVVAKVRGGFGQRMRARAAWMRSAPHRRILLRLGFFLRIVCVDGYCVGR